MESISLLDPWRSLLAVARAVRASPGAILGWWAFGSVVGGLLVLCSWFAPRGDSSESSSMLEGLLYLAALAVVGLIWRAGLARVLQETLRSGHARFAQGWSGMRRVPAMLATYVLVCLALFGASVPFAFVLYLLDAVNVGLPILLGDLLISGVLWLYLALGLSLAPCAAALEPIGPYTAVARAWRVARGRRSVLLGFWAVTVAFSLAGFLLLGIGLLASSSLLHLMPCEAWLELTRPVHAPVPGELGPRAV
ncbi:MAG: hypothetical protein ABL998_10720 [Planctomycetota bacterium]